MRKLIEYGSFDLNDLDTPSERWTGFAFEVYSAEDFIPMKLINSGILPVETLDRIRYRYLCIWLLIWNKRCWIELRLRRINGK